MRAEAKEDNARYNAGLRQTGNAMDLQYDIPEVSKRILDIVGREHNNGLALLSELGFPRVKKCKHILNIC